jgi:nucleoid-associated protein Lsr2
VAITKRTVVDIADDLTGENIPEGGGRTVRIGIGTPANFVTYELELTTANEQKLEDLLKPYTVAARTVKPGPSKRSRKTGGTADSEIRKWARAQGIQVPPRGKISDEVRAAYNARSKTSSQPADLPYKKD